MGRSGGADRLRRRPRRASGAKKPSLEELISGSEPDVGGGYIVVPREGQPYLRGTMLPALRPEWATTASGLLVPAAATKRPVPGDLIKAFVTDEDVFGFALGPEFIERTLPRLNQLSVLSSCARLLVERQKVGASWRDLDLQLAAGFDNLDVRQRAENLIRSGRALIAPQAVLNLAKAALRHATTDGDPDMRVLTALLIAVQSSLGREDDADAHDHLWWELIRNQAFSADMEEGTQIASFQLRWNEIPPQLVSHPEYVDLAKAFNDATGISLTDPRIVGMALWAMSNNEPGLLNLVEPLANRLGWTLERLEANLALMSSTPEALRDEIDDDEKRLGTQWSFDVLRRFPIIRVSDEAVLVLSTGLLLDRIFGWLPLFDLQQGLRGVGRPMAARAETFFRRSCEREALDAMARIVAGPAQRFYDETALQRAFGADKPTADAALDYGDTWLVVEITTHQLKRGTVVAGRADSLETDLAYAIDAKVAQLDSSIRSIIENEQELTGVSAATRRAYVPILLATEGFPTNPMTYDAVADRVRGLDLLTDPRIAPLRILDLEELYFLEALATQTGASAAEVIEGHIQSGLAKMGLKDYLLLDRRVELRRPERLADPLSRAWDPLVQAVEATERRDAEAATEAHHD